MGYSKKLYLVLGYVIIIAPSLIIIYSLFAQTLQIIVDKFVYYY